MNPYEVVPSTLSGITTTPSLSLDAIQPASCEHQFEALNARLNIATNASVYDELLCNPLLPFSGHFDVVVRQKRCEAERF